MSTTPISIKWLIYAFIIGLSANASFAALTSSVVPFSPFPFITLCLAVNHFYTVYVKEDRDESTISGVWISLFIGIFSYSAVIGALHPELGSNFLSIALTLILGIWLMYKVMFGDKHYSA